MNCYLIRIKVLAGIAHGTEDPAPVGVSAENGSFGQCGGDNGFGKGFRALLALCAGNCAGNKVPGPFAVGGHFFSHRYAEHLQRFGKCGVVRSFGSNGFISRQTVGQDTAGVIGRGVSIYADAVETDTHRLQKGGFYHLGRDSAVSGQETEHGAHVGVNHAAAFGNAADADRFPAYDGFYRCLLFRGIRGHDGMSRRVAGLIGALQRVIQRRDARLDGLHIDPLADDACGGDQHVIRFAADGLSGGGADPFRIFFPLGSAGVGIAAVGNNGAGHSIRQVLNVYLDGGSLYHIFCK